jgi:Glyoxalase/Bleomycin resistance protein/Dioxygenase superfamily
MRVHACMQGSLTAVMHVQDPSGYLWEVLPAAGEDEPVREVNMLVSKMEESVRFYRDTLGMHVVRREGADGDESYDRVCAHACSCVLCTRGAPACRRAPAAGAMHGSAEATSCRVGAVCICAAGQAGPTHSCSVDPATVRWRAGTPQPHQLHLLASF